MPEGFLLRLLALLFPITVYAYPEGASKVGVIQLWQLGLAFVNQHIEAWHYSILRITKEELFNRVIQYCTLYSMHEKRW
jgi:hypothetical protein